METMRTPSHFYVEDNQGELHLPSKRGGGGERHLDATVLLHGDTNNELAGNIV